MTELIAAFAAVDDHFHAERLREDARLTGIADAMRSMETGLAALRARHEARLTATKGRFNVFTILRRKEEEVGLHSRWLSFLLNPTAAHDCGALFLKEFIATLRQGVQPHDDAAAPVQVAILDSFDCDVATVRCEQWGEEGRMDIRIESPRWGIIVIENKIHAPEQPKQIQRYAEALLSKRAFGSRNFLLLYLTLDGRPSEQAGDYFDKYHRISYHSHILKWLTRCMRETYLFPNINHALQQYAAVVRQLTGGGSGDEFMKELTDLLTQHPALIANMRDLKDALEELRQNYWQRFARELREQLRACGVKFDERKPPKGDHVEFRFAAQHHLQFDDATELQWILESGGSEHGLWFGLTTCHYGSEDEIKRVGGRVIENKSRVGHVFDALEARFPRNFFSTELNPWWPVGYLYLSVDFLSDAYLAKHAAKNSTPIAEQVKSYCDIIRDFMETTVKLWPKG